MCNILLCFDQAFENFQSLLNYSERNTLLAGCTNIKSLSGHSTDWWGIAVEQFQNYHLWSIDSYIEIDQEYSISYLGNIKNQPCIEFFYNPNTSDTIKSMKALSIHAGCCYFELNRWSWAIPFALFLNLHKGHSTCSFEYKNIIVPHKSQNMKSPPRACAISMLLLSAAFHNQRN